uniref:Uncharacterized protein n=1 Tax=Sphaerodactylus townsendi TaxID=933632 RepID=A0ACB8F3P9_9SAUR
MADPLRRTLSKLRGRRAQRGAAGALEAAGHPNCGGDGAVECKAHKSLRPPGNGATGAPCTLLGSQTGCYRVLVSPWEEPRLSEAIAWPQRGKAAVPGEGSPGASVACSCHTPSHRDGTTPQPPSPPGLRAPPPPPAEPCFPASVSPGGAECGSPSARAGGSEEEDYYDNQSLPDWGCQGASGAQEEVRGKKDGGGDAGSSHRARARESTGRLRSQLQEAYYLLIHAMHDLPPASPSVGARSPQPAATTLTRVADSSPASHGDGCSGLQQVAHPGSPVSPRGPAWRQGISKSLESLLPAKPLPLPRCRSDGALRSLLREPLLAPPGHLLQDSGTKREAGFPAAASGRSLGDSCERCPGGRSACAGLPSALEDGGEQLLHPKCGPEPGSALSEASASAGTLGDPAAGGHSSQRHPLADAPEVLFKPPAVTVRKLQKWMYKGRLLSLGMKGRGGAAGPPSPASSKASGTRGLLLGREEGPTVPSPTSVRASGSKTPVSPSDQRLLLTDLIENVYIPSVSRRELKNFKSSEMAECKPQIASITVSKKRNWLHQSSPRAPNLEKGDSYKQVSGETHQVLKSPGLLLEPKMPQTFPKPLGYENPNRINDSAHAAVNGESPLALQNHALEFGEDNDADDEGEIWYNPIPEDDDPDFPCFVHNNADNSDSQAMSCKISSGNDLIKVAVHNEGLPQSFNCTRDAQPREIRKVDCVHSTEYLQVQKPKPSCTILSGFVTEDSSTLKGSSGGNSSDFNLLIEEKSLN